MGFEYFTNITSIVNSLKHYNTTTATPDLCLSLTSRISDDNIFISDPKIESPRADRIPCIYVKVDSKDEEFFGLGETGTNKTCKKAIVNYTIYAIVGKYGAYNTWESLLTDVYALARNIEHIFQNEYTLSNTAMWCNVKSTSFPEAQPFESGFVTQAILNLEATYQFR